jgi:hypothetical protein
VVVLPVSVYEQHELVVYYQIDISIRVIHDAEEVHILLMAVFHLHPPSSFLIMVNMEEEGENRHQ